MGGDELRLDLRVGVGARALVTTPAAGKAYRTTGPTARQAHTLAVEANGTLEWLPQETIVYDGARVELETRIDLGPGARSLARRRSASACRPARSRSSAGGAARCSS